MSGHAKQVIRFLILVIESRKVLLEVVKTLLPRPITLDPDLHTSEYRFLSTTEIHPQLYDIAVIDGEWP